MERIYLDHAATSPMHPKVMDAMYTCMKETFGNASSIHYFGRQSRQKLDNARQTVAQFIGAKDTEIIFTSGGTEADNLAIFGVARANTHLGKHIITTQIEHHAVLHACKQLENEGFLITYLPVDEKGRVSVASVRDSLREDTILVTIMFGNNEVGSIQPIVEIGELLKNHQAVFHTDAVQVCGVIKIDVEELAVDLLSVSAHKMNGPKGIGFLYVRNTVKLSSIIYGGEHERKRRAGTENVSAIVGLAQAVRLVGNSMKERQVFYRSFKEKMISIFESEKIEFAVNGMNDVPHILNIAFFGMNVEVLLTNLDLAGIAVSSGSACTAGSILPSHVLVAMFGESERVTSSIRFSFGLFNTMEQIEKVADEVVKIVKRVRG